MPEPVLVSIAVALASKVATSLFEVVKKKFDGRTQASAALEAAVGTTADSAEVRALSEELAIAERMDPEFAAELRAEWRQVSVHQHASASGVSNSISGDVGGNVVQARDIQGGVSF